MILNIQGSASTKSSVKGKGRLCVLAATFFVSLNMYNIPHASLLYVGLPSSTILASQMLADELLPAVLGPS